MVKTDMARGLRRSNRFLGNAQMERVTFSMVLPYSVENSKKGQQMFCSHTQTNKQANEQKLN